MFKVHFFSKYFLYLFEDTNRKEVFSLLSECVPKLVNIMSSSDNYLSLPKMFLESVIET